VRQRIESRIRKQIRRRQHRRPDLGQAVRRYERPGLPFAQALHALATDPAAYWDTRREIAGLLAPWDGGEATLCLLAQFFELSGSDELYQMALILERSDDARALQPLIGALEDGDPGRRRAAARALGWMRKAGTRAVIPLAHLLTDASQPVEVREEAAESLANSRSKTAIPALVSTLSDPYVGVRFWSVFALGGVSQFLKPGRPERRAAVEALESMLADEAVPPGNWWSVGRESLAMLAKFHVREKQFEDQTAREIRRIMDDPAASPEDRRWAECYG
jgi:hypothetical protein